MRVVLPSSIVIAPSRLESRAGRAIRCASRLIDRPTRPTFAALGGETFDSSRLEEVRRVMLCAAEGGSSVFALVYLAAGSSGESQQATKQDQGAKSDPFSSLSSAARCSTSSTCRMSRLRALRLSGTQNMIEVRIALPGHSASRLLVWPPNDSSLERLEIHRSLRQPDDSRLGAPNLNWKSGNKRAERN